MDTIIIAEAGVNHNGDIELAKRLIEIAAEAGADYVKFQTFIASKNIGSKATKANYQAKNTNNVKETQLEMVQKLELSREDHEVLIDHCNAMGIQFLSTAFDFESVDLLLDMGQKLFKIPSGEVTNLPLLNKIAAIPGKKVLSTGMCDLGDVERVIHILEKGGTKRSDLIVLHCNTQYPTPFEDVNLNAMTTIGNAFKVVVGYSDHTLGIEVPIAAVAMGAKLIEKHFTVDRTMEGPDHAASLEPDELKLMVSGIRNIEMALGDGIKRMSISEKENLNVARKSIFYSADLPAGKVIQGEDLIMKRPGDGISPLRFNDIIGKTLNKNVMEDEMCKWGDLS